MAQVYKVTFTLTLADDAGHPSNWIPTSITGQLERGEDAADFNFVEVGQTAVKE